MSIQDYQVTELPDFVWKSTKSIESVPANSATPAILTLTVNRTRGLLTEEKILEV